MVCEGDVCPRQRLNSRPIILLLYYLSEVNIQVRGIAGQGPVLRPNMGREPDPIPITLVDIAEELVDFQAKRMRIKDKDDQLKSAREKLGKIRWDMPG